MPEAPEPPIIIRLGGSVVSHDNIIFDFTYLRELRDLLQDQILLGKKFAIIIGGGQNCRNFMDYARLEGGVVNKRDLHWIGAAVNTLHAEMLRGFFGDDLAEEYVWKYQDRDNISELTFSKPIVIIGGFKAGISSDGVALTVARGLKCKKVYDLKLIDGVYDKDPKIDSSATFQPRLTWNRYLEIIGNPAEHKPGDNLPVDVIAARAAKDLQMEYYILKATDFNNIEAAISGGEFRGTIIMN